VEDTLPPDELPVASVSPAGVDLGAAAAALGVALDETRLRQMHQLVDLVQEWNGRISLTSIRDREGIELKHIADSLAPAAHNWRATGGRRPESLLDVGSGAGFPALPLAILHPEMRVTALEMGRKKADFISLVAAQLGLDVRVVKGRAETEGQLPVLRERFDLVVARAVAYLPALAELCLPFVRVGGYFVAMKSEGLDEEIADGLVAVETLGGLLREPVPYVIPGVPGTRWLLIAEKVGATPREYPREPGVPKRQPIVAHAPPRRRGR
jgi:16S rRNA (guanine527-N7)-methyltransferase